MRRLFVSLTIALVLLVCGLPLRAQDLTLRGQDLLLSHLGEYLDALRVQTGIPGLSAAIVGDSDILWERTFGMADLERPDPTLPDTPFHVDGLTQTVAATMLLRCVEEGRLSLDDRVARFIPDSPDADATLREILTHTSRTPDGRVFAYRLDRLAPVASAIEACTGRSFRRAVAQQLERLAMFDSVPGPDAAQLKPAAADPTFTPEVIARYGDVMAQLATPYEVDKRRHASPTQYVATTLTPANGLVSTTRDWARFDLALRQGVLLQPETLAEAWQAPLDGNGQPLPHGLGWFVQTYNRQTVVWQFGLEDNATSSLIVTVPDRHVTLILFANSDGLAKSFELAGGDVTTSPFARVFLGLFVR